MTTEDRKALRIAAEQFEDAQKARIAASHRAERGGVDADTYQEAIEVQRLAEKQYAKLLRNTYRRVAPAGVIDWQKEVMPYGAHLVARLLGAIGHPRVAYPHHWEGEGENRVLVEDQPYERMLSQLWAYCGHGDPQRKRRQGMSPEEAFALGNPTAKMLTHLLAESRMKARCERYRPVYDREKARWADRDVSDGHRHNHALRITGKEILRDLFEAAAPSTDLGLSA